MADTSPPRVVFCAAAGPRMGFGHLVRCRSLAHALGVEPIVALRASARTRDRAAAMGRLLDRTVTDPSALGASMLVIDDPSAREARRWLARARRAGVPAVSVHDLGLAYVASDLLIDGSVAAGRAPAGRSMLAGPAYAILDPALARQRARRTRPRANRVLIALGGGQHVRAVAARLADALARHAPHVDLRVAAGFTSAGATPALPVGRWVDAPAGLAGELAEAEVAIVAGGVTLYEACALGVPVVAAAVTTAQRRTIGAMARRGAVIDGGGPALDERACDQLARAVARLLADRGLRSRLARAGRRLVDGRGAHRVARRLHALAHEAFGQEARRAR